MSESIPEAGLTSINKLFRPRIGRKQDKKSRKHEAASDLK